MTSSFTMANLELQSSSGRRSRLFVAAFTLFALLCLLCSTLLVAVGAFSPSTPPTVSFGCVRRISWSCPVPQYHDRYGHQIANMAAQNDDAIEDEFSSFAASLDEDEKEGVSSSSKQSAAPQTTTARKQPAKPRVTTAAASNVSTQKKKQASAAAATKIIEQTWQADLDELLDPMTRPGRRQQLLQKLVSANQDIRASVEQALKDRKLEPLLTPRSKMLQDGARAVARQISSDIIPSLAAEGAAAGVAPGRVSFPAPHTVPELNKVGGRVFNAIQNQLQRNLETLQGDLANPSRIPQRISKQTEDIVKEAANIFAETPIGLKEPSYKVVRTTDDYEIRDYDAYKVATTNIMPIDSMPGEVYRVGNVAQMGAAFNSLAAYLFGANRESKSMDMTTPVTTTMRGEMRFFLSDDDIPEPLEQDESKSVYETGSISIEEIPPARLAVRRFTGFVTEGEIARQKEALLLALELDGVELDVPHGQTVGHVVFQYNPPYTVPIVRRNEIAVPVVGESNEVEAQRQMGMIQEDPWDTATSTSTLSQKEEP